MADERSGALRRVPLLAGLDDDALDALAAQFRSVSFDAGDEVIHEGQRGARVLAFFVIERGSATVARHGAEKATLGPGDHFGEIGLSLDRPRTATVTADTDLACWALSAAEFRSFVEAHPAVAWPLLETMARRLAELLD